MKLERKNAGGRKSEQHPNHPQPKPSPVQSAVGCAHQESDSTATSVRARTEHPNPRLRGISHHHHTLSEIVVHLYVTKNIKCFYCTLLTSLNFGLSIHNVFVFPPWQQRAQEFRERHPRISLEAILKRYTEEEDRCKRDCPAMSRADVRHRLTLLDVYVPQLADVSLLHLLWTDCGVQCCYARRHKFPHRVLTSTTE